MRTLRGAVKAQVLKTTLAVKKYFPEGTRFSLPTGGSLLWIQLPGQTDGMTIYRKALEKGISILPGDVCSVSGVFRNYIRIGCGHPFTPEIEGGIRILGELVDSDA